ncbi:MAG: aspartate--tRNA ligase [Elusimicrobia bacterium]|jgi:aspartyl-tRNA synthetase|nr:aspartate--tRNA ligase [Elusimicrobiota bacterium]
MFKSTNDCGQLTIKDIGKEVMLSGWVSSWRDHGGVIFIDLRDIAGITQIVFGQDKSSISEDNSSGLIESAHALRNEYVISVKGIVAKRPEGTINDRINTGKIEVRVKELEVLNKSKELPYDLKNLEEVSEELRLKYRYLEMRTGKLKDNLIFKHRLYQLTRNFFTDKKFYEIETPVLTRSTPEGARDFLVPSRLNPGSFYALPQSPQLFKQTLMIGGFMRYFQITKCFRDEDLRQDRQPEFTQLDMEMSFIDEKDLMELLEKYIVRIFGELLGIDIKTPFLTLPYDEAMLKYGTDKPDLRIPVKIKDITGIAASCSFNVFKKAAETGAVRGIKISGADGFSRSRIDTLTGELKEYGAKGLAWIKITEDGYNSQIVKFFEEDSLDEISEIFNASPGDIIFFVADSEDIVCKSLDYLRRKLGKKEEGDFKLLWITDYPLFDKDKETGRYKALHHPFTAPAKSDVKILETSPGKVRARAYDMVLNGSEIGGGSIRIHSSKLQQKVFDILGIAPADARKKFGFLLDALEYGAPPHGGFAFGLDRLVTMMRNLKSIREVIPFPKTQKAYSPLTEAPSTVDLKQLEELGLKVDIPEDKL